MSHVFGYTIANDITARDIQKKHIQWFKGKSLDTTCPLGPYVVPACDLDPSDLSIKLWLNDSLMQDSRTSKRICYNVYGISYSICTVYYDIVFVCILRRTSYYCIHIHIYNNTHVITVHSIYSVYVYTHTNLGKMIFNIPAIIASLSEGMTLLPGDVILTGRCRMQDIMLIIM